LSFTYLSKKNISHIFFF